MTKGIVKDRRSLIANIPTLFVGIFALGSGYKLGSEQTRASLTNVGTDNLKSFSKSASLFSKPENFDTVLEKCFQSQSQKNSFAESCLSALKRTFAPHLIENKFEQAEDQFIANLMQQTSDEEKALLNQLLSQNPKTFSSLLQKITQLRRHGYNQAVVSIDNEIRDFALGYSEEAKEKV
jgi:hypothetical protein